MESSELVDLLLGLIAPEEITKNFTLVKIFEAKGTITLVFEEKTDRIPEELMGKEVVLDGFLNTLELQSFPLKDKTVYFAIKRRRWKEKSGEGKSFSNAYDLHDKGMKTTREFGAFLKEELGLQPGEYNELWRSLTDQG
jgi:hypothetical protein